MKDFLEKIARFNEMYKIKRHAYPLLPTADELMRFKSILQEELNEIDEIIERRQALESLSDSEKNWRELKLVVDLADWYGDMIVYSHTSADSFGLPMDRILNVIMESNFSKLGADGKPVYDERGKVIKGPNFIPPEPEILGILLGGKKIEKQG